MKKPTVAVIFGSRSAEHDVSVVTAIASIIKPLRLANAYEVLPVYISKDGNWYTDPQLAEIEFFTTGKIDQYLKTAKPVQLVLNGKFALVKPGVRSKTINVDVVFPSTHGTHGEDGELMGILGMANVPFVGCDMASSVIAMDKVLSKQVTSQADVPTTPWLWFSGDAVRSDIKQVAAKIKSAKLAYPLFVKPAHLGSSIGITQVKKDSELANALEVAAHYDNKIIVEQGVANLIEVTLPIMGNDQPEVALLERPLTSSEDFFDFETKYLQGGKKGGGKKGGGKVSGAQGYSEVPAKLAKGLYDEAVQVGLDVYKAVGCCGIARIDMLIDGKSGKVFFNEINPLPGSLYSHNWAKAGVSNVQLVQKLVDYAVERHKQLQKVETTFSTSYLKQF
jgi:D-alanine-D-alanine ligase